MPVDHNDPEIVALLDAAKREAAGPIQSALNEAAKNLAARDAVVAQLTARATAAEEALKAATESGTATAAEIEALRAKVEAADAREAAARDAALAARVSALPDALRVGAPTDPGALATWIEHREAAAKALPAVPPLSTGAGGGAVGITDEMRAFARKHAGPIAEKASDDTIKQVWTSLANLRTTEPAQA